MPAIENTDQLYRIAFPGGDKWLTKEQKNQLEDSKPATSFLKKDPNSTNVTEVEGHTARDIQDTLQYIYDFTHGKIKHDAKLVTEIYKKKPVGFNLETLQYEVI